MPFETHAELREIDVGTAKGASYAEAAERWPDGSCPKGKRGFPAVNRSRRSRTERPDSCESVFSAGPAAFSSSPTAASCAACCRAPARPAARLGRRVRDRQCLAQHLPGRAGRGTARDLERHGAPRQRERRPVAVLRRRLDDPLLRGRRAFGELRDRGGEIFELVAVSRWPTVTAATAATMIAAPAAVGRSAARPRTPSRATRRRRDSRTRTSRRAGGACSSRYVNALNATIKPTSTR